MADVTLSRAQGPGERAVERVGEGLLVPGTVGGVAAGLHAGAAQAVHEIAHRQSLPDDLWGVLLAPRVDDVVSVDKNFPYSLKAIMEGPLQ